MRTGLSLNEALDADGVPRAPYAPLFSALERMRPELFARRRGRARELLERWEVTFPLPGEEGRMLPADWLPRIITGPDWRGLAAGLLQRGRAINAWLCDLYHGEQEVVPHEVLRSSVFYRREAFPEGAVPVHVYGPDVVHLPTGEYVVLEDNVRVPSGVAYVEAVRLAAREALPELLEPYAVLDTAEYYLRLQETLRLAAPAGVEDPSLAVLTAGPEDPAYFEHGRVAEACSIPLLTPSEVAVEGDRVVGPDGAPIHALYRRVDGGYAVSDVPGLERALGRRTVGLANALGVGVADDKAVYPYVGAMIRTYLGEEPLLGDVATIPLADPERREEALERLPELVLKPREGYGGLGVVIGPETGAETIEQARRDVRENPEGYVAQECLDFSMHLLDDVDGGGRPRESYIDLRAFVLPAVGYVLPGGLTRVARPGTRVVNSSSGGSFKDTWVLEG